MTEGVGKSHPVSPNSRWCAWRNPVLLAPLWWLTPALSSACNRPPSSPPPSGKEPCNLPASGLHARLLCSLDRIAADARTRCASQVVEASRAPCPCHEGSSRQFFFFPLCRPAALFPPGRRDQQTHLPDDLVLKGAIGQGSEPCSAGSLVRVDQRSRNGGRPDNKRPSSFNRRRLRPSEPFLLRASCRRPF